MEVIAVYDKVVVEATNIYIHGFFSVMAHRAIQFPYQDHCSGVSLEGQLHF